MGEPRDYAKGSKPATNSQIFYDFTYMKYLPMYFFMYFKLFREYNCTPSADFQQLANTAGRSRDPRVESSPAASVGVRTSPQAP